MAPEEEIITSIRAMALHASNEVDKLLDIVEAQIANATDEEQKSKWEQVRLTLSMDATRVGDAYRAMMGVFHWTKLI